MPLTRRRFLAASARAAAAAWLAPSEARRFTVPFVDEGAFPLERTIGEGLGRRRALDLSTLNGEALLIRQERFFIRTGCPDRLPPVDSWKVVLHGLVEAPLEVSIGWLWREAAPMGEHLLECAGNSRALHFGLMSAAAWSGVRLERLLARMRRRPGATRVLVSGFDDHTRLDRGSLAGASWIFGLEELLAAGAFLATGMNGGPLAPDHGHPVRLVVPGWYACTAIKWVNEIVLVDDRAAPTGHMREYAARTHQDPVAPALARDFRPATIDPAAVPVRVEAHAGPEGGLVYRVVGLQWGGPPAGEGLSIRLNPDHAYRPVQEAAHAGSMPWALWSHEAGRLRPGRYRIDLAFAGRTRRTRRLDRGFYAREVVIEAG